MVGRRDAFTQVVVECDGWEGCPSKRRWSVYLPQLEQVQLEPQLQLEAPEQPQSPAIVNGGLVWVEERVCGWSLWKLL